MSTTEIAKIIIDDIYPTLKNSTYTGIPKYDNGKIIIDHLVITGFKIISTLFDQKNIHCNIDELLSEKKIYTEETYLGDLSFFNNIEYAQAEDFLAHNENKKEMHTNTILLNHAEAVSDNKIKPHPILITKYTFEDNTKLLTGKTITTNPNIHTNNAISFYNGKKYDSIENLVIDGLPYKPERTISYIGEIPKCFFITPEKITKYQEYYTWNIEKAKTEFDSTGTLQPKTFKRIHTLFKNLEISADSQQKNNDHTSPKILTDLIKSTEKELIDQLIAEKIENIPKYNLKTAQAQRSFDEITNQLKTHKYIPELYEDTFKHAKFPQTLGRYAIDTEKNIQFNNINAKTIKTVLKIIKDSKRI